MNLTQDKRVVITGLGCCTSAGMTTDETWRSMLAGKGAVSQIDGFDTAEYPTKIAAEIKNFNPADWMEPKHAKRSDRSV